VITANFPAKSFIEIVTSGFQFWIGALMAMEPART
jgi:hypothetical protein